MAELVAGGNGDDQMVVDLVEIAVEMVDLMLVILEILDQKLETMQHQLQQQLEAQEVLVVEVRCY
jgi:hypothetical protein